MCSESEAIEELERFVNVLCYLLHVRRQGSFLQKLATTNRARMRNSSMKLSVIDELELASEGGTAISTSKWIDRSMESRVHVEMLFLRKTLTAILRRRNANY